MSFLAPRRQADAASLWIGKQAVRALHAELVLHPKPGLVSPLDSGAHDDMDAGTFLRSLFSLRRYFSAIAAAGAEAMPFPELQRLGIQAEARMLTATQGVNTHRGAIFCLGLLAAAAGWRNRRGLSLQGGALGETVVAQWGDAIAAAGCQSLNSNGGRATRRYGARGAREEALDGFPTLTTTALPALLSAQNRLGLDERARVQSLFAVMAVLEDTNLLHRGGPEGLHFVQSRARAFLERGGVERSGWREQAMDLHRACVARRLSPGGAADILAAACFVQSLTP